MHDRDDDLSAQEKAEFAALPRERVPGRMLEERAVKALHSRGLLRPKPLRTGWLVAAAAIVIASFTGGFAAGQWTTSRGVTESLLTVQRQTALQAAQLVQQTGSAYVTALAGLAQLADSSESSAVTQGREAAIAALYAAARELVGIVPDDPVAIQIRRLLAGTSPAEPGEIDARSVVWF